jgi:predicted permease
LLGEGRIRAGWVMLGAVGLLLLLACVSVSNLLIARASTRGMEMSVRVALGAGVRRLVRQLLVESVVIGVLAAVAGIMIAFAVLPVLRALTPADTPRIEAASVDAHVMVFAVVVGLLTGLVFGLAPVLHAVKRDPGSTLRAGRGQADGRGERLRALLVAGQVAMTVTLLVAAGLLGATFLRMHRADTGLPVEQVWAVPLTMSAPRYTGEQRAGTAREIRTRLVTLPGITAAGSTNTLPFGGGGTVISIAVEGRPGTPESAPSARWRAVGEGFFEAVDAAPLEGRLLESADFRDAAEPVVVVGQSLAMRVAGDGESAVGRRIAMGWDGTNWRRVVGVVRDIEDIGPDEEPPLTFYFPGEGGMSSVVILFRTAAGSAPPAATAIRDLIHDIEPDLPVPAIERLDLRARRRLAGERFYFTIVGSFSIVALLLAVMGVYGVTRFSVAQRIREVCVRIALGARPRDVVRLLLGRSLIMAAAGVVAGIVLALALTTTIESLLFDTSARDPWVFLAAAVISGAACAAATWLPAHRAARISPAGILSS